MGQELESVLSVVGPTALLLSAVALAFTLVNWVLRRRKNRIALGLELVFFITGLLAYVGSSHWRATGNLGDASQALLEKALWTTWGAAVAFVANALLGRFVLEKRKLHDGSPAMPKLLRELASIGLYVVAGMMVVHFVFDRPVTALAATSGAMVFILGYSAQSTLGEVFAGLSLNLAQAFKKGEWVKIGDAMGMVTDHNWRALTIRTKEGNLAVVPNSVAAKVTILNFSQPAPESRGVIEVLLDYSIAPGNAVALLEAAVRESPFVLEKPRPKAVPHSYGELGIKYKVKFWCEHGGAIGDAEVDVLSTIWHHLDRAGHAFAWDRHRSGALHADDEMAALASGALGDGAAASGVDDADPAGHGGGQGSRNGSDSGSRAARARPRSAHAAPRRGDPFALARRAALFARLSDDEIRTLTARTKLSTFGPPERIIRQGDEGDSMFLLSDGAVEVSIRRDDGTSQVVANLGTGESFGVMSLLTGEKRSATVRAKTVCTVFEIEKRALRTVFEKNAEAMSAIAEHVGQMQLENERKHAEHQKSKEGDTARKDSLVTAVFGRIRDFFAETSKASRRPGSDVRF